MKTEIDNYRGYEIRFDTEHETFECDIDDSKSVKKSYSAIKKFIDDFIKDNQEFKQFKVEVFPNSYTSIKKATVVGIRKDKRFVAIDENGYKFQISEWDEDKYNLVDERNIELVNTYNTLTKKMDDIRVERDKIKFFKKPLKDIKSNYSI